MAYHLFDSGTTLPDFEGFHFKIRGWFADKGPGHFDKFLRNVARNLELKTAGFRKDQEGVAFIKLKRESDETRDCLSRIGRLCRAILDPKNRSHVDVLTDRSLLGISPLMDEIYSSWTDALFQTALQNGPSYLKAIYDEDTGAAKVDCVPSWAVVLAFATVSHINLAGYQLLSSSTQATSIRINQCDGQIASLFGEQGVGIGGNFLKRLLNENQDVSGHKSVQEAYGDGAENLIDAIEIIFRSLGDLIESKRSKDQLSHCCKQAKNTCFSATLRAAEGTLANKTVLKEYLELRSKEVVSTDSSAGVAAIGLLSTAAMSVELVRAPLSLSAGWAWATTGSWPTVLAVTNPVGAVVGFIGLAMVAAWRFNASARSKEILYHQRLVILISWCCIIINALDVLLKCIDYLEKPSRERTASTFIRLTGNKDIIDGWDDFVEKDYQERKERLSSQKKGHHHRRRTKSGLNKSQRQVRRYMKKLAETERTSLVKSLDQLRDNGKLYETSGSESEGESTE